MDFEFEKKKKPLKRRVWFQALTWIVPMVFAVMAAWFIIDIGFEKTSMPGHSMEPTLSADTEIVINKWAYKLGDPERFDVVVFKQSGTEHGYYNIKRIIGMPTDRILIADGKVYINEEELAEPMMVDAILAAGLAEETITLEENEYFVLGDNRNNSEDSRFATVGCIVREDIVGKAWMTLAPFNFVSKLNQKEQ